MRNAMKSPNVWHRSNCFDREVYFTLGSCEVPFIRGFRPYLKIATKRPGGPVFCHCPKKNIGVQKEVKRKEGSFANSTMVCNTSSNDGVRYSVERAKIWRNNGNALKWTAGNQHKFAFNPFENQRKAEPEQRASYNVKNEARKLVSKP